MTRAASMADLARQSSGRPLSPDEQALAEALEAIFSTGEHDFDRVAQALQTNGVKRPSGTTGDWTATILHDELRHVNAALDKAYSEHGFGP